MAIFTGVGTAVVTPFNNDGSINFDAYENLIEFQIKNGADAIISCGTTGEASTLTDDEQLEVVRCAVSKVNKRVPVIAGATSNHTDHGKALCIGSQKAGADACMLASPYYNKTTQKGLVAHFSVLAACVDLPIILYNIPGRTALNINPETLYELSKVENIVGVKEASGDFSKIAQTVQLCGDDFDIYSGNDEQILPILSLGGRGVISTVANICPQDTHNIVEKYLRGDLKGSLDLQLKILPLINALFIEVNPIPVKEALNLMGMNAGGYRMPLVPMEEKNAAILRKAMEDYGLI